MSLAESAQPLETEEQEDRVVVRLMRPDVKNAIGLATVEMLHEVCAGLERRPRMLVLTGHEGVFASGADVRELRDPNRHDALAGINSSLFERIRRLPLPTVAAIDGLAFGAGAELAYACDFRVATERARFGNPEVSLGILATAGACWRLRELVGEALAYEMLFAGRTLDAQAAVESHLVTEVAGQRDLLAAAHALLDKIGRGTPLALRLTKLALQIPASAHPAFDNVAQAVFFETEEKHARMTTFLERHDRSPDPSEESSTAPPRAAGVLGGGRMGAGIAHALLSAGCRVQLVEITVDAGESARARIEASLRESDRRGSLPVAVTTAMARLSISSEPSSLVGSEIVVEALPEDPALKARLLVAVEAVLDPGALLATNTSSLSIDELSAALERPRNFIGLHFFNPVPASELVEVVVGSRTSDDTVERARRWVEELGKTSVTIHDSPGFATSRLGVALGLEAIRMLEEGVGSAEDIDTAMVLGYRHLVGPLRLTDLVGLDVRLAIAEHLASRLGPRFEPPEVLRRKVEAGELGRKSGQGFYSW